MTNVMMVPGSTRTVLTSNLDVHILVERMGKTTKECITPCRSHRYPRDEGFGGQHPWQTYRAGLHCVPVIEIE